MKKNSISKIKSSDEIDLSIYIKKIIFFKRSIFKITLLSLIFGIIFSIMSPVGYVSTIKFSLLSSSQKSSTSNGLSSLASLAGVNLLDFANSSNVLNPNLYPYIFNDFRFKRKILEIKLENNLNFKDYLLKKNNESFLSGYSNVFNDLTHNIISYLLPSAESNNSIINNEYFIDEEEKKLFEFIDDAINISINKKEVSIDISTQIDNPVYSSIITNSIFKILEKKIIDINIQSSKDVLDFNQKNYDDKRLDFLKAQSKLAEFKDKNQAISSSKFNSELFVLQNEFNLINSVFQEVSKQLELSKIQITKDTPVFTVLKDAEIPTVRNKPKRKIIVSIFTIIGFFSSCFFYCFRDRILTLKSDIFNF